METTTAQPRGGDERAGLEVSLMVYDLKGECNSMAFPDRWAARVDALVALVNACASPCGLGVFHSGVAVGGREYAYGYCPEGSGVYTTAPGENPMYVFRAAVPLGSVALVSRVPRLAPLGIIVPHGAVASAGAVSAAARSHQHTTLLLTHVHASLSLSLLR